MHVLLNDYGSGVMLLGSDLCGCLCQLRLAWADIHQRTLYVPCV